MPQFYTLCPLENTVLPASIMTIENDELRARICASLFRHLILEKKKKKKGDE